VAVGIGVGVTVGRADGAAVGAWVGVAVGAAVALGTGIGVGLAPVGVRVGMGVGVLATGVGVLAPGVGVLPTGVGVLATGVGDAPIGIGVLPTGVLPIGPGVIAPDGDGVAEGDAVPSPGALTGAISPTAVGSEPPPPLHAARAPAHTTDEPKRMSERIQTPPRKTRILNRFFGRRTWREHMAAPSVTALE